MLRSLYAGMSGLEVNTLRLDVIGNNIANVNTIGFKASRATFQESMNQLLRGASGSTDRLGGRNPQQIGLGARVGSIDPIFSQGSFESTGVGTDLAVQGSGFFILSDGVDQSYTRDGAFQVDASGFLISPTNGQRVQGFAALSEGESFSNRIDSIRIPLGETAAARATQGVTFRGNLDADSEPRGTEHQSDVFFATGGAVATAETRLIDLAASSTGADPILSSGDEIDIQAAVGGESVSGRLGVQSDTTLGDLASAIQAMLESNENGTTAEVRIGTDGRIYIESSDALGNSGAISSLLLQAQDSEGENRTDGFGGIAAMVQSQTARDAGVYVEETTIFDSLGFEHTLRLEFTRVSGSNEFTWTAQVDGGETAIDSGGSGTVSFGSDGSLQRFLFDGNESARPTGLTLKPGNGSVAPLEIDLQAGVQGGLDGITMMRGEGTLEAIQDGYAQGNLVDFQIGRGGEVVGLFSNGVTRSIAQVALADFVNPAGLVRAGDNLFQASLNSGDPTIATADALDANIWSGALEQSNVDLASEFTNMILAQRGFQASARVISTSDEILAELLDIKG